jgi:hypothetical protein
MGDAFEVVNNNRRTAAQLMQRGHTLGRLQRFHQLAYSLIILTPITPYQRTMLQGTAINHCF